MHQSQKRSEIIEHLFSMHADSIYRYAKYSLPCDVDAKDVVQEVFLRAFRNLDQFKGEDPKTWLFRIARNCVFDVLRKKRSERAYLANQNHQLKPYASIESLLELEDALSRLQPTYRQVLILRWIQDLTVEQTAAVLGWSDVKVRVMFHRAKKKLREALLEPEFIANEGGTAHGVQK
ncbi:sigma-70 family RNA polymerase sigma factor [Alicyclobacillus tolerans]|uniref:RNA polymerase sigma factor n=1 Tax=Alicyclobacillus tolerans TaxID=90970 RepID=UPI001F3DC71F|nr:sigma-70 family RNA polymerase sigma factor [Alicyclobacillus tolerans]MCF8566479.1 sigma-70 family RNA polymerase sigma factor [Alicyclobacillus tolerans]